MTATPGPARSAPRAPPREVAPVLRAGLLLGLGLGGFVDGILLHQILQWHHMATSHPDPAVANDMTLNTTLDGLFHAATWLFVVAGLALLVRAWRRPGAVRSARALAGAILAGWGAFNLVEGIVDHHLLAIHHVNPGGPGGALVWDVAFLALGALLLLAGWGLARSDREAFPEGRGASRESARGS